MISLEHPRSLPMVSADPKFFLFPPVKSLARLHAKALARLVAVVGSAIALRELFLQLQRYGKSVASNLGERALETDIWGRSESGG